MYVVVVEPVCLSHADIVSKWLNAGSRKQRHTIAKLSQDLLDRFSRSLHQMKGICVNLLDPDLFFDSLRDVAMATNFWQNLRNDLYSTCWHFATDSNVYVTSRAKKSVTRCSILAYGNSWQSGQASHVVCGTLTAPSMLQTQPPLAHETVSQIPTSS